MAAPRDHVDQRDYEITAWPQAGEAVIQRACRMPARPRAPVAGRSVNPTNSTSSNTLDRLGHRVRRARSSLRRYMLATNCRYVWTLTYAQAQFDYEAVRKDWARFARRLSRDLGRLPWARVIESHPGGHGFHIHAAFDRFIPEEQVTRAWSLGHVAGRYWHAGRGRRQTIVGAAHYLGKDMPNLVGVLESGKHLYEVAQGFRPLRVHARAPSLEAARARAINLMGGGMPTYERRYEGGPRGPANGVLFMVWDGTRANHRSRGRLKDTGLST